MTDVIFDNSSEPEPDPQNVRQEVVSQFREYFNKLQLEVFVGLQNYQIARNEWPTGREVAAWMDEPYDNVQPRLSELQDMQAVIVEDKRVCSECDHNTKVSVFRVPEAYMENE